MSIFILRRNIVSKLTKWKIFFGPKILFFYVVVGIEVLDKNLKASLLYPVGAAQWDHW
jgi:hypothetical protein